MRNCVIESGLLPFLLDNVGATLAVARGRFLHNQPFPYNGDRLPLLPDRGKPCPYNHMEKSSATRPPSQGRTHAFAQLRYPVKPFYPRKTAASYPGAHTGAPLHIFISSARFFPIGVGATIGRPSRAVLSTRFVRGKRRLPIRAHPARNCFLMSLASLTKAFSRGEGGTLPVMTIIFL